MRKQSIILVLLTFVLSVGIVSAYTWTPPTFPFPYGAPSLPLDTSGATQPKGGAIDFSRNATSGDVLLLGINQYIRSSGIYLTLRDSGNQTVLLNEQGPFVINVQGVRITSTTPSTGIGLEVAGQVKIRGGSPGVGKYLISTTTDGLAVWGDLPASVDSGFHRDSENGFVVLNVNSDSVGIGTTTPQAKLDVVGGGLRIQGDFERNLNNKYISIPEQTNPGNDFKEVAQVRIGPYMTIGNFGFGNNDFIGTNAILDYSWFGSGGAEGEANKFKPQYADGKGFVVNPSFDGTYSFYGINWDRNNESKTFPNDFEHIMTLTSNGKIGIGTKNPDPAAALDIQSGDIRLGGLNTSLPSFGIQFGLSDSSSQIGVGFCGERTANDPCPSTGSTNTSRLILNLVGGGEEYFAHGLDNDDILNEFPSAQVACSEANIGQVPLPNYFYERARVIIHQTSYPNAFILYRCTVASDVYSIRNYNGRLQFESNNGPKLILYQSGLEIPILSNAAGTEYGPLKVKYTTGTGGSNPGYYAVYAP